MEGNIILLCHCHNKLTRYNKKSPLIYDTNRPEINLKFNIKIIIKKRRKQESQMDNKFKVIRLTVLQVLHRTEEVESR